MSRLDRSVRRKAFVMLLSSAMSAASAVGVAHAQSSSLQGESPIVLAPYQPGRPVAMVFSAVGELVREPSPQQTSDAAQLAPTTVAKLASTTEQPPRVVQGSPIEATVVASPAATGGPSGPAQPPMIVQRVFQAAGVPSAAVANPGAPVAGSPVQSAPAHPVPPHTATIQPAPGMAPALSQAVPPRMVPGIMPSHAPHAMVPAVPPQPPAPPTPHQTAQHEVQVKVHAEKPSLEQELRSLEAIINSPVVQRYVELIKENAELKAQLSYERRIHQEHHDVGANHSPMPERGPIGPGPNFNHGPDGNRNNNPGPGMRGPIGPQGLGPVNRGPGGPGMPGPGGPGSPGRAPNPSNRSDEPNRPGRDEPSRPRSPEADRGRSDRPQGDRQQGDRQQGDRQQGDRQQGDRQQGDRQQGDRQQGDRPARDPGQASRENRERPEAANDRIQDLENALRAQKERFEQAEVKFKSVAMENAELKEQLAKLKSQQELVKKEVGERASAEFAKFQEAIQQQKAESEEAVRKSLAEQKAIRQALEEQRKALGQEKEQLQKALQEKERAMKERAEKSKEKEKEHEKKDDKSDGKKERKDKDD